VVLWRALKIAEELESGVIVAIICTEVIHIYHLIYLIKMIQIIRTSAENLILLP
jgi:hypothetical protein